MLTKEQKLHNKATMLDIDMISKKLKIVRRAYHATNDESCKRTFLSQIFVLVDQLEEKRISLCCW